MIDGQDDVEHIRVGQVGNEVREVGITSLEIGDDTGRAVEIDRLKRLRLVLFKVDPVSRGWSGGTGQSHYIVKVLSDLTNIQLIVLISAE